MSDDPAVRTAITDLVHRYCRGVDRLDLGLVRDVFHSDAHADMGAIYQGGLEGFLQVLQGFMGAMVATRHEVSTIVVVHDGDAAQAESYVVAWHRLAGPDGDRELLVRARYLQAFARRDGVWRILRHGEVMDWGEERPIDPAWFDGNAELDKGARGRADPSYRLIHSSAENRGP